MNKKDLFDGEKVLDIIIPVVLIEAFVIVQIVIIVVLLNCLGVI